MTSAYDTILELLPSLTAGECEEIRKRLIFFSGHAEPARYDIEDWLLDGIKKVSKDRGFGDTAKVVIINTSKSFRGFKGKSDIVRGIFTQAIPNMTKVEKSSLGELLAQCLCVKLSNYRAVSFLALMHSVEQTPEAFEEQFPNYLRSGLAHVVIRGLSRKKEIK
jgi:hypothetical protein